MPELIDKHAAYTALKHEEETHGLSFSAEAFGKAARIIDQMPTIEAEPVRRGRWIDWSMWNESRYQCSECNCEMKYKTNFCPRCGAEMLGAEMRGGADNG